jgi:alanyl-tRNA synthetase
MKKTEKKTDKAKKKSGQKKLANKGGGFDFNSKQVQKEFTKRMKVMVQEVKKDTEKTIKALLKEAKQKIQVGSEVVRRDVLKSIVTQYDQVVGQVEKVAGTDHGNPKPAPKTSVAAAGRQASPSRSGTAGPQTKDSSPPRATATRTRKNGLPVPALGTNGDGQAKE